MGRRKPARPDPPPPRLQREETLLWPPRVGPTRHACATPLDECGELYNPPVRGVRCLLASLICATSLSAQPQLVLHPIATGLNLPLGVVSAGDSRVFIVQQRGRILKIGRASCRERVQIQDVG